MKATFSFTSRSTTPESPGSLKRVTFALQSANDGRTPRIVELPTAPSHLPERRISEPKRSPESALLYLGPARSQHGDHRALRSVEQAYMRLSKLALRTLRGPRTEHELGRLTQAL